MIAAFGGNAYTVAAAPLLTWWVIAGLAAAAILVLGVGLWRRAGGVWWRTAAVAMLLAILINPSLVEEKRSPLRDVAVVVVDESPSQQIGDRSKATEAALAALTERLGHERDLDVRVIRTGKPQPGAGEAGQRLFTALGHSMSDIPRQRLAGVVMLTDGQVHDVPTSDAAVAAQELGAPLHVLLSGRPDEGDRRLVVAQASSFGLVGKELPLSIRVEDLPTPPKDAPAKPEGQTRVTWRKDGGAPQSAMVPIGRDVPLSIPIDHGGPNVLELEVEPGPHELTLANNRAAVVVNGVRDRLRVLLVTGEPHAGERVWRNILKSDPSVDLVHFTILRPPEKQDGTPIKELSLIAFPIRELFDVKLDEFDLIIFDRYSRRGVIPQAYIENVVRYVRKGGAFLEAAGPSFGTPMSLYRTPLGEILPTEPTGNVYEDGYKPQLTDAGRRHPVTEDLSGAGKPGEAPSWGRWFRQVEARVHNGTAVMSGEHGDPLLVLDRIGKGRVAQLLSDQMWLWARGFEGGGPQAELLRRLAYWLMKEPDLEENDLRAAIALDRRPEIVLFEIRLLHQPVRKPPQQFGLRPAAFEAARPQPHLIGQELRHPPFADPVENQQRVAMLAAHHSSAVVDARLDLAKPASPTGRLARLSGTRQVLGDGMAAASVGQLRFESVFVHIAGRLGRQDLAQRRPGEARRLAGAS